MYPELSGTECRSSEGRAEPVAERMRSTRSRPGAAPPEAILCNDPYLHGHAQAQPRCQNASTTGKLSNSQDTGVDMRSSCRTEAGSHCVPSPFIRDVEQLQSRTTNQSMQKGEHWDTACRRGQAPGGREPQGAGTPFYLFRALQQGHCARSSLLQAQHIPPLRSSSIPDINLHHVMPHTGTCL